MKRIWKSAFAVCMIAVLMCGTLCAAAAQGEIETVEVRETESREISIGEAEAEFWLEVPSAGKVVVKADCNGLNAVIRTAWSDEVIASAQADQDGKLRLTWEADEGSDYILYLASSDGAAGTFTVLLISRQEPEQEEPETEPETKESVTEPETEPEEQEAEPETKESVTEPETEPEEQEAEPETKEPVTEPETEPEEQEAEPETKEPVTEPETEPEEQEAEPETKEPVTEPETEPEEQESEQKQKESEAEPETDPSEAEANDPEKPEEEPMQTPGMAMILEWAEEKAAEAVGQEEETETEELPDGVNTDSPEQETGTEPDEARAEQGQEGDQAEEPAEESTEEVPQKEDRILSEEELAEQDYRQAEVIRSEGTAVYEQMDEESLLKATLEAGSTLWIRIEDENWARVQAQTEEETVVTGFAKLEDLAMMLETALEEELPVRTIRIVSSLDGESVTTVGEEVELRAELNGFLEDDRYTVQWQYSPDGGETVFDAEDGNELIYRYKVSKENYGYAWRMTLVLLPSGE